MNIYILTEEKPKKTVITQLLNIYAGDFGAAVNYSGELDIIPCFCRGTFCFKYIVQNATAEGIDNIIIKTVSGGSSFIDFLFFVQEEEPIEGGENNLIFAVEETKTSDDESRNTGVFQRCSKFVYVQPFYNVPLYMLYNDELELRESKKPSDTSIFGTNMLLTCGVKIVGKPIDRWFRPFESIDQLIEFKNGMKRPPEGNTPILIRREANTIYISGRLDKPKNEGRISHDPNIGALSMISWTLRVLGWEGNIVITQHGISQTYINNLVHGNKFLFIANILRISLEGIVIARAFPLPESYWHYEQNSEKMASILFHVMSERAGYHEIYQNHAGCERGYFRTSTNQLLTVPKYCGENSLGKLVEADNTNKRTLNNLRDLLIPDVIVRDDINHIVYLMEGKQLSTLAQGLEEIEDYDDIETLFINKYYPGYQVKRYLTIFGGCLDELPNDKVLFYLRRDGILLLNDCEHRIKSDLLATI